jgi:hypothetical protein
MTKYLRARNAGVGDQVVLSKDGDGRLNVEIIRLSAPQYKEDDVLILSGGWKVIKI